SSRLLTGRWEEKKMIWSIVHANRAFGMSQERAAEDKQFRTLALTNPSEAVKQLTGMELPERIHLTVTEDEHGQLQVTTHVLAPSGQYELDEAEAIIETGGASFAAFFLYGPPYSDKRK